jgi:hypothetical protein
MDAVSIRNAAFIGILLLVWFPGVSIILYGSDLFSLGNVSGGDWMAVAIVFSGPIIAQDASLIGELTPFTAAGALVMLAPRKGELTVIVLSVIVCVLGWLIYLVLSVLISPGREGYDALLTIVEGATGNPGDIGILQAFSTSTRVLYLVVAASLLGLKIRKDP